MHALLRRRSLALLLAASACGSGEGTGGQGGAAGAGGGGQGGQGGAPVCGDALCAASESCGTCALDCGTCCGDGTCDANELCSTCAEDCGACAGVPPVVTRGPYLQRGSESGVVVRWRTDAPTASVVALGLSPGSLPLLAFAPGETTEHRVEVEGLSPDTVYHYGFGAPDAPLSGRDGSHFVRTAPPRGTARPRRIWVLGDAGTADADQRAVRDAYLAFTGARGTDLLLFLGDNAYLDGTDDEYQAALFDVYPNVLRNTVAWSTLGNHDGHSADSGTQTGTYYDVFSLPRAAEAGGVPSGTEAYYSFEHGNVHFVCLDSYDSSRAKTGDMLTWLEADLAANTQPWLVAFWHHPPYSKGSHDSDDEIELVEMRENALPILEAHGVDLVLSGHSHAYERTFLLHGHHDVSSTLTPAMIVDDGDGSPGGDGAYDRGPDAPHGAVYVVAGSSGQTTAGPLDHPAMFVSLLELGSLVLDVDGDVLDVTFLDDTGAIGDAFRLQK